MGALLLALAKSVYYDTDCETMAGGTGIYISSPPKCNS